MAQVTAAVQGPFCRFSAAPPPAPTQPGCRCRERRIPCWSSPASGSARSGGPGALHASRPVPGLPRRSVRHRGKPRAGRCTPEPKAGQPEGDVSPARAAQNSVRIEPAQDNASTPRPVLKPASGHVALRSSGGVMRQLLSPQGRHRSPAQAPPARPAALPWGCAAAL